MSSIPPFSILRRCRNLFRLRDGLSLIEVLVALSMTLVILVAMMRAFKFASEQMSKGRASLEMTNRIRTVQKLLKSDLENLTVEVKPYAALSDEPKGYFELIDGRASDVNFRLEDTSTAVFESTVANLMVGDFDDVLAGTIKSNGKPFRGRFQRIVGGNITTELLQSAFAEVVWFTRYTVAIGSQPNIYEIPVLANGDQIRLYRKQLLIASSLDSNNDGISDLQEQIDLSNPRNLEGVALFFANNDISARAEPLSGGGFRVVANTLDDLDIRGNRFGHVVPFSGIRRDLQYPQDRPFRSRLTYTTGSGETLGFLDGAIANNGQDLMLTEVLGFDLKVYAPGSQSWVRSDTGTTGNITAVAEVGEFGADGIEQALYLGPRAPFAASTGTFQANLAGSFVDLGHLGNVLGADPLERLPNQLNVVAGGATNLPQLPAGYRFDIGDFVYDTGTPWYNTTYYPGGSNGIDDDGDGVVDDFGGGALTPSEKIHPPYAVPLRGIQATVRVFEPASGQVTQMTSRTSFIAD